MKETIHDQFLAPKQVTFNVELLVLESGEVYKVEEQSRHALAIVGGLTTSGLGINVLNDIGGATIGIIT